MRPIAVLALLTVLAGGIHAQFDLVTPSLEWRTVETKHFVIHYPARAEAWTLDMASRIDSAYGEVSALVGFAPPQRVTLLVEDPNNIPNGFALPFLDGPVMFFWPTPAGPYGGLGGPASWGTLLSVHEYAHIAHLTRPSRNPAERFLEAWTDELGPVAAASPRWAVEGYATFVEGRLTGAGRPHSAARAAILREWALSGALPTYGELDGSGRYLGGDMAYLVGSAYLEWLVARPGQSDSSLPHVWRRMSARTRRSFDDAFAGVFGAPPAELYGRFTAEITERAFAIEKAMALDSASAASATRTVQRLMWNTGSPALSANDSLVAVLRSSPSAPAIVNVWRAHAPPDTTATARIAREKQRDPLDVPGIPWKPAPLPLVAERGPQGGASFDAPRWMRDGASLLVTRATGPGDGVTRRDLFLWTPETGSVRRITHAGGIRNADALPDGKSAIADQCLDGVCSLVRVDLATGSITTLVTGSPRVVYERPRVSPDGAHVVASRHSPQGWRVVLTAIDGTGERVIGPTDGAERYDAAWRADGRHVVLVSEQGGIPNLEDVDVNTGSARALTRVIGAVRAPEPESQGDAVYYLRLHARGLDLDAVNMSAVPALDPVPSAASADSLAPVAFQHPVRADSFPAVSLTPHAYGLGPRSWRLLGAGTYAAEGASVGLMASTMDPVGKLTAMAQGYVATRGTWQGASLGAAWRGWPVVLRAEAFYSEDKPSLQWGFAAPASLDATMAGGVISARLVRDHLTDRQAAALGTALSSFRGDTGRSGTRALAFANYDGSFTQSANELLFREDLSVSGALGTTLGEHWARGVAALRLYGGSRAFGLEVRGSYGRVDNANAGFEQLNIGGTAPPFFERELYAQRLALPAVPAGVSVGQHIETISAALPFQWLRPYFWAGSTSPNFDAWQQVVGLEASLSSDGIWYARLPGFRVLGGVGYAVAGAWRHEARVYLETTFHP